jgi:hypothetical protein
VTLHEPRIEPETPLSADRDIPDTEVIALSAPTPVFVDSTGRRRKVLRRLAYAFGGVCVAYGGLIGVSMAGGPVSSSAILPLPDLPLRAAKPAAATPGPRPTPSVTTAPAKEFAAGPLNRRPVEFARTAGSRHTPAVIPPPPTTKPATTSSQVVESTTTTRVSTSTSTSTSPTPGTGTGSSTSPSTGQSSSTGGTKTGESSAPSGRSGGAGGGGKGSGGKSSGGTGGGTGTTTGGSGTTTGTNETTNDPTGTSGGTGNTASGGTSGTTTGSTASGSTSTGGTSTGTAADGTKVSALGNDTGRQLQAEIGNDLAGRIGDSIGSILELSGGSESDSGADGAGSGTDEAA